jgi:hypothetical protein
MFGWLIGGILLALALLWLLGWWSRTDVKSAKSALFWAVIAVCGLLSLILMAAGRGVFAIVPVGYAVWQLFGKAMFAKGLYDKAKEFGNGPASRAKQSTNAVMSRAEALEVLGLADSADVDEINTAYKKMMARVHPDKGGNDWMAAKINEAKRVLLDE